MKRPLCKEKLALGGFCNTPCEAIGPDTSVPPVKHYRPGEGVLQIATVSYSSLYSDKCFYHNSLEESWKHALGVRAKRRQSQEN